MARTAIEIGGALALHSCGVHGGDKFFSSLLTSLQLAQMPKHAQLEGLGGGMNIMLNKTARTVAAEEYHHSLLRSIHHPRPPVEM